MTIRFMRFFCGNVYGCRTGQGRGAAITSGAGLRTIERRSIYDARLTDEEIAARLKSREPSLK
jgi:hypothetical protein